MQSSDRYNWMVTAALSNKAPGKPGTLALISLHALCALKHVLVRNLRIVIMGGVRKDICNTNLEGRNGITSTVPIFR